MFWFLLLLPVFAMAENDWLELFVGEQRTLNVQGALQVFIAGQGRIAKGALLKEGNEVVVTGVQPGTVSMTMSYRDGRKENCSITVVGRETETLYNDVKRILADIPGVQVRKSGNGVELAGSVGSEEEAQKVALICLRFPEVFNFTWDARSEKLIQLDVEIVEVNLTDGSDLGIDWFGATSTDASVSNGVQYGALSTEDNAIAIGEKTIPDRLFPNPHYAVGSFARLNPLTAKLHFLITKGHANVLARPKLVCKSGDSALFLSGGEVPLPLSTQDKIQVDWKEYGIKLEVQPILRRNNGEEMEVRIACEISDLDWSNRVHDYPAMSRKLVKTKVNMNSNDMLALAGLMSERKSRIQKRLPVLGAIPFLGRFFSSTRDELKNMETIILLTPHIVVAGKGDNIKLNGEDLR
ncbi:MAG: hypothetical protein A2293_05115 [Elusimicrobia bacterium RIFOXYB2_FULL_49_7]|nr:MAG: hypothetical protein A2293_05115 [Elusimicrobia bacterium RIFOXYB2_FULL_49_7]